MFAEGEYRVRQYGGLCATALDSLIISQVHPASKELLQHLVFNVSYLLSTTNN